MSPAKVDAFSPLQIGPLKLRNRFIKTATNEGMCKGGIISKGLAQFHERVAEGGAALSTVAYCATSPDGKTFVDQARLGADTVADFRALTDGVHKHGAAASAQITHAGCFTFLPKDIMAARKPLSASGGFNKVGVMSNRYFKKKMDRDDMDTIAAEFVSAAKYARESGFDAVELHMGHGYLLSQFISPFYNKRKDAYGGTIEKRMKFPAEVLAKVLDAVGKDVAVIVKYSQTDGREGGNTIDDGIKVAKILEQTGAHLAVLSNGMNVEAITAMFGSSLPTEVRSPPKNPIIRLGMAMQKMTEPANVQFREMYLLEHAKKIRSAVDMPLCYLGGVQTLDNVNTALTEGLDAVALGRALVFDPGFINGMKNGSTLSSGCTACNQCVTMMYTPGGTACIDPAGTRGHASELNTIAASAS
ncbi:MAG: NADH:flavin oxidoreductase [Maricaulaceae bacterium]